MTTVPLFVNFLTNQPMDIGAILGTGTTGYHLQANGASSQPTWVGFLQVGTGAVVRTWQSKAGDFYNALDFGVAGNGTTDDTTAINNALAQLAAIGGGTLYFPPGFNCKITATININVASHVGLYGYGSDQFHDGGPNAAGLPAAKFTWAGAASGTMLSLSSPTGVSNPLLVRLSVQGLQLDGAGSAGIGLQIKSVRKPTVRDVHVENVTTEAYLFTCGITSTDYAEAADIQDGTFENLTWRMIDTAPVQSAHGIFLTGSTNANISFNVFRNCLGETKNGHGIACESADNNTFIGCVPSIAGGGTGKAFIMYGTNASHPTGGECNYFVGCSWASFAIQGIASGFTAGTTQNMLVTRDLANAAPVPTIDAGCDYIEASPTWRSYTPTVTPGSGTYTTVTATGQFLKVGKSVKWFATVTYTNIGSGGTSTTVSLPSPSVSAQAVCSGQETATSGALFQGTFPAGGTTVLIRKYDGTLFIPANGNVLTISGFYQTT